MFDQEQTHTEFCKVSRDLLTVINNICTDITIFHECVHAEASDLDESQKLELNFNLK